MEDVVLGNVSVQPPITGPAGTKNRIERPRLACARGASRYDGHTAVARVPAGAR